MKQIKNSQVGMLPSTGVVPVKSTSSNGARVRYLELYDLCGDWICDEIERLSAAYVYKDGQWFSTGMAEMTILFKANPKLRSKSARDKHIHRLLCTPSIVAITELMDDRYVIYFNIGHHTSWIEFRKTWNRYSAYFEELHDVTVRSVLEPEWQELWPLLLEDVLYANQPVEEIHEILPEAPYEVYERPDTLTGDLLWANQETKYAQVYNNVLSHVNMLIKYGIDTTATELELRNRCYECASLGSNYGRILFHALASLNPKYDRAMYDDIFTGILHDHQGKRDMKTFVWCYENIYAAQVAAAAKLEQESFDPNEVDDEQQP